MPVFAPNPALVRRGPFGRGRFRSPHGGGSAQRVPLGNMQVQVDWNGDGSFTHPLSDITGDVVDWGQIQSKRGREGNSQLTSRATAGSFQCTLKNFDGKYSRDNVSSPLYGLLDHLVKVRWKALTPYSGTLWSGVLHHVDGHAGGMPSATFYGTGIFSTLGDQANQVSPLPLVNVQTGAVITSILDAAGHPSADRTIDTGYVPVGDWAISNKVALTALQEIEEVETGGFIYEGLNFNFVFEDRYHRTAYHNGNVSQATFSDDPASTLVYIDLQPLDPRQEIFNEITATVQPYNPQALAVLWTLSGGTFVLSPGGSITINATYSGGFVLPWTIPVVGTDIIQTGVANSDINVATGQLTANTMPITLTNNNATANALITLLQAQGIAYATATSYGVTSRDAASQLLYRRRVYPLPGPYYPNQTYAQNGCDYWLILKKDPHPMLTMTIPSSGSDAMFQQAVTRAISDRITVVSTGITSKLGINGDFFIEAVSHTWGPGLPLETTYLLSPANALTTYAQFDVSLFDVGKFGY